MKIHNRTREDLEKLRKALHSGLSTSELKERYGVSAADIRKLLKQSKDHAEAVAKPDNIMEQW